MTRRTVSSTRWGVLPLLPALWSAGAGADVYTPPASPASVDALVAPQQDNGYGLGALIALQQAERPASPGGDAGSAVPGVSAATRAARRARAARQEIAALQARVKTLGTELATRAAQQQATGEQLKQLQAKMREQEKAPSPAQVQALAEASNKLNEKDNQLTLQKRQLDALQAQLALTGDTRKVLDARTAALTALQEKMSATQRALASSRDRLAAAEADLGGLRARSEKEKSGTAPALTTPAAKQDYVVGQSIAANLRTRLQSYAAAGLTVTPDGVLAGIRDGFAGTVRLKKDEMDAAYRQFATALQQQVDRRMAEGQKQIARQGQGRKPARQVAGITYFVVKKGKPVTDPDAPVALTLTETVLAGRTISHIPRLVLMATDEMPDVIREALPLLGEGSRIQAYALARSVYGERPLPRGVEAFTVLGYDIRGLPSAVPPSSRDTPRPVRRQ
jgi:hypothetical protein